MDPSNYGMGHGPVPQLPGPMYPNPHHHLNLNHHQNQTPSHHLNPGHHQNPNQNPNHHQNPNSSHHQNQNPNQHHQQNPSHHLNLSQSSHHQNLNQQQQQQQQQQHQNPHIHTNLSHHQNQNLNHPHQNPDQRQNQNLQGQVHIQISSPHPHQNQMHSPLQTQIPSPHHNNPIPSPHQTQMHSPHPNPTQNQNLNQQIHSPQPTQNQNQNQTQIPSPSPRQNTGTPVVQSPEEQQPNSSSSPPKEGKANNTFIAIIDRLCMETRYAARFGVKLMAMGILDREKLDDIMEEKDEKIRARRIYHEAMKMSIPWDKLFQALLNSGNVNVIDFIKQDIFLGLLFDAPKHDTPQFSSPGSSASTSSTSAASTSTPSQYPMDYYSTQNNSHNNYSTSTTSTYTSGTGTGTSSGHGPGSIVSNYERSSVIYKNPSGIGSNYNSTSSSIASSGMTSSSSYHQNVGITPKGGMGISNTNLKAKPASTTAKRKASPSKTPAKPKKPATPRKSKDSSADPGNSSTNNNNSTSSSGAAGGKVKRRRRRKATPEEWLRVKNKMLRMTGQEYMGYTKVQKTDGLLLGPDGQPVENGKMTVRKKRELGPPCDASKCINVRGKKGTQCRNFTEEDRLKIFQRFWLTMDWEQRKVYVSSLVDVLPKKTSTVKGRLAIRRRDLSFVYMLKLNGEKQRVCKKMFLSTLGIGPGAVSSWVLKSVENAIPRAPKGDFHEFVKEKKIRESGPKIPKKKGRPRKERPAVTTPKIDRRRKKQLPIIPEVVEPPSTTEETKFKSEAVPVVKMDLENSQEGMASFSSNGDGPCTPPEDSQDGDSMEGEGEVTPEMGNTPEGGSTPEGMGPTTPEGPPPMDSYDTPQGSLSHDEDEEDLDEEGEDDSMADDDEEYMG